MTVKSPFYNKPSTSTSVDSCHKCPLIPTAIQQVSATTDFPCVQNQVQQQPVGFDQSKMSATSSNNLHIIEPSNSSVAKSDIGSTTVTSCSNCGTTTTPLWRRSPLGETICNACGLYYKARNTCRPVWLKRNLSKKNLVRQQPPLLAPALTEKKSHQVIVIQPPNRTEENNDLVCANCSTKTTPLWRRDESGQPICNACGLYFKLHNVHRPMTMKRSTIKRRKRITATSLNMQKPVVYHHPKMDEKRDHLRPLLPTPSSSPEPIEPNVHRYYLPPSPPMRPSKNNIACLLNPEVETSRPHLPSPPMVPHDDMRPCSPISISVDNQTLEAHRNELKREVNNLTSLLSRTTAMLQNIDHVMATSFKK